MVKIKIHPQDEKSSTFLTLVCKQKQIFLSDAGLVGAPAPHLFPLWHPTAMLIQLSKDRQKRQWCCCARSEATPYGVSLGHTCHHRENIL